MLGGEPQRARGGISDQALLLGLTDRADEAVAKRLWEVSEERTGVRYAL